MTINPTSAAGGQTPAALGAHAEKTARDASREAPAPERRDQVEISAEGRQLAAAEESDRPPFTEARLQEIRALIASGRYERPEVVSELAQRLVDSGDL